jgi:hypothetical protein
MLEIFRRIQVERIVGRYILIAIHFEEQDLMGGAP